jgi:hypothetical protein
MEQEKVIKINTPISLPQNTPTPAHHGKTPNPFPMSLISMA